MMMHHAEFTEICGFGCCCFLNAFPFFLFFSPLRKGVSGVCVCVMRGKTEANGGLLGELF